MKSTMIWTIPVVVLLTFSVWQPADSQAATPLWQSDPRKEASPSDQESTQSPFSKIGSKIQAAIKQQTIAGASALIFVDGETQFEGHWGKRDIKNDLPVERDTIFRIYSMTKPITSIATMQLVEQGKIKLDEPLSTYLPEFASPKVFKNSSDGESQVDAKREITPRDLLRHTSGLTYGFFGNTEVDKKYRSAGILSMEPTIEKTVEKVGKIPLLHHPGSKFHYSISTDVLGRLIEVASGQRFDKYLKKHVFEPLGMVDTYFTVPEEKLDRLAELYRPTPNGGLKPAERWASLRFRKQDNEFFSGGGGLCSTQNDYLAFCKMLLNEGKFGDKQIVKPETLKMMFTNQLADIENPPSFFEFGLGFRLSPRGDFGWGGAAGTKFWVNPKKKLAVLFMIQLMPDRDRGLNRQVLDIAHSALKELNKTNSQSTNE